MQSVCKRLYIYNLTIVDDWTNAMQKLGFCTLHKHNCCIQIFICMGLFFNSITKGTCIRWLQNVFHRSMWSSMKKFIKIYWIHLKCSKCPYAACRTMLKAFERFSVSCFIVLPFIVRIHANAIASIIAAICPLYTLHLHGAGPGFSLFHWHLSPRSRTLSTIFLRLQYVHDNNNAGKEEEEEKKEQKTNTLQQLQNDREREKNAKELKQWMWSNANAYLFQSQVTIAIFFPLSKQSNVVIIFLLLCLYLCNLISYTHTNTQLTQLINLVLRLICVHDMYSTYLERLHLPRIETVEIEAEAEKNKLIYLISRFYRYLVQILSLSHFLSISKREGKSTSFALFSPLALVGWQSILRNSILNWLWAGKKTVQFFFCCRPREEKKIMSKRNHR